MHRQAQKIYNFAQPLIQLIIHLSIEISRSAGARDNVNKVVFLLTDGKQNPTTYDTLQHAQRLRDNGVKIFAIGITQVHIHIFLKQLKLKLFHKTNLNFKKIVDMRVSG